MCNLFSKYKDHTKSREEYWKGDPRNARDLSLDFSQLHFDLKEEQIPSMNDYLNKHISGCMQDYIKRYTLHMPGFTISPHKLQQTYPGSGYHIWHSEYPPTLMDFNDSGDVEMMSRFAAYTIYLNDIEEGGETEFLNQSLRVSPKKGTLAIFPAYFTHLHRGNPPLNTVKYIITGWLHLVSPNQKPPNE